EEILQARRRRQQMLRNTFRTLTFVGLLALGACGGPSEYVITGTERTAGTDGMVIVEEIEGNRMVTVELEHLPPPNRISDSAMLYVVWIKPDGGQPSMAGRLEYDEDDRAGRMRATTPHTSFTVMVTAEDDPATSSPSDVVIARQEVEED
ncbi:MAG: hypothetical protein AAGE52_41835, partial [Myxococcota bacterium]